jgi:hypothetical protein
MEQTGWDRRGVLWGLSAMAGAGILGARVTPATAQQVKYSSGTHKWRGGKLSAYAESKLCDVLLAFAVARRWPNDVRRTRQAGVTRHSSAVTHWPRQHLIDEHMVGTGALGVGCATDRDGRGTP